MAKIKKIGIVTLSEWIPNYGSRLQYFALQTIFGQLGWRSELIQDVRWWKDPTGIHSYWWYILHCIFYKFRFVPSTHAFAVQILFFIKRYLNVSPIKIKQDSDMEKLDARYDMFCCGSDQVWNPYYNTRGLNSFTTLQFTKPEKRTSYAASIATKEMIPERAEEFANYIKDFRAISVREETGAKIVKDLTGRDCQVHIDPTLMFTGEQWVGYLNLQKTKKNDYVLVFLYNKPSEEVRRYAEGVALEKNAELIFFEELKDFSDWSVQSWLNYIRGAKHVITDSFHCTVFSTLFHVPFTSIHYPLYETTMGSRIKNLVKMCGMPYRHVEETLDEVYNVDWNEVDEKLNKKREESWKYFRETII